LTQNRIIGISKTGKVVMCSENGNKHITITGASGTGKTYLNCVFILQAIAQGIPVVVIDVGNSFSKKHLPLGAQDFLNERMVVYEAKEDIHINPFILKKYMDDEIYVETPDDAANRIAGIFKTSFKLGSLQYSSLLMAVTELMNDYNDNIVESITMDMIYDKLMSMNTGYARNVALKIYPVMNGVHFSKNKEEDWVNILDRNIPKVTVFQLSKLENYEQKLTADFIIDDLNKYISINGSVEKLCVNY
jgi:hypothetical protein